MTEIGLKIGSLNTVFAYRNGSGIQTKHDRTCVRYPFDTIHNKQLPPIVGEAAAEYDDVEYPLYLGVIEEDKGIQYTKDILSKFDIPKDSNIVVAAPAVEIRDNRNRLINVIKEVFEPKNAWLYSEGLCSAVSVFKDPLSILNSTFFCLNLGSSTTEFGCFSEGQTVYLTANGEINGDKVDSSILNKISSSVGETILSEKEARDIKESSSMLEQKVFTVKGKTRKGIFERQVSDEISESLNDYIDKVSDYTKHELLKGIPSDVMRLTLNQNAPFVVSGGMSNIKGLPESLGKAISEKMNHEFKIRYPEKDAHLAPAVGALLLCEEVIKEEI